MYYTDRILKGGGGIVNYKETVTRSVILLNKTLGEYFGDQIGGEQATVLIYNIMHIYFSFYLAGS